MSEARCRAALKLIDKVHSDYVAAESSSWDEKIQAAEERLNTAIRAATKRINDALKSTAKKMGVALDDYSFNFQRTTVDRWGYRSSSTSNLVTLSYYPDVKAAIVEIDNLRVAKEKALKALANKADNLRKMIVVGGMTDTASKQLEEYVGA